MGPHQVREILALAHLLEREFSNAFATTELAELKALISQLEMATDPSLQRLAEIARHLHPDMSLKHFVGFMVLF